MEPITKLSSYINSAIPYAWDDSESWFEFLAKVFAKVNEVIEKTNDYFDVDIKQFVVDKLNEWRTDGTLESLFNIVFQDYEERIDNHTEQLDDIAINVKNFGAKGDGITNDTIAVQNAINDAVSKKSAVYFPGGTYLINQVTLPENIKLFGGGRLKTNIKPSGNNMAFLGNSGVQLENIAFVGNGKATGYTLQHGISFTRKYRWVINNCFFSNLGGKAINFEDNHVHEYATGQISDTYIKGCNFGIYADENGEYVTIVNTHINGCNTGIHILGGNNIFTGGTITENDIGVYIGGGSNSGHGIIGNTQINHNIINVKAEETSNGFLFDGCNLMVGDIQLKSCTSILFNKCMLLTTTIYEEGCVNCRFKDCHDLLTSVTIVPNHNGLASQVFYENMSFDNGTSSNTKFGNLKGGYFRGNLTNDVSIPAGQTLTMPFTKIENRLSRNADYSKHEFYDPVDGSITNFGFGDNSLTINLMLQITGAVNPSDVSIRIYDVTAGHYDILSYVPIIQVGSSALLGNLVGILTLAPAHQFDVKVRNHGSNTITITASLSNIEVVGL